MKYRKKPVVIEAMQWNGSNTMEVIQFGGGHSHIWEYSTTKLEIATLEGDMRASVGDWIIKGVKGEFYPCKPDVFELTYEKINP